MKQRILTSAIGIPLVVVVLLFSNTVVLPFAVGLCAAIGVFEMLSCIGLRRKLEVSVPSVLFAGILTFATRYVRTALGRSSYFLAIFAALAFVYIFYLLCLAVVSKGTKALGDMALCAVTTIYITAGFTSMILLRDVSLGDADLGIYMLVLVFIGAWIPDAAGYFCGRAFGKHKLIPDVSPKKTVEGAVGGVIFGGIAFALLGFIVGLAEVAEPNYVPLAITGVVVAVISIFGDLIASLIKRQYGIKDYGKLFPGHGGVMDRFDSILAIAPFLMMICSHPEIFSLFR